MDTKKRYFGSNFVRELADEELLAVSGGARQADTDTGTDNGRQCDADSDYAIVF